MNRGFSIAIIVSQRNFPLGSEEFANWKIFTVRWIVNFLGPFSAHISFVVVFVLISGTYGMFHYWSEIPQKKQNCWNMSFHFIPFLCNMLFETVPKMAKNMEKAFEMWTEMWGMIQWFNWKWTTLQYIAMCSGCPIEVGDVCLPSLFNKLGTQPGVFLRTTIMDLGMSENGRADDPPKHIFMKKTVDLRTFYFWTCIVGKIIFLLELRFCSVLDFGGSCIV